MPCQDYDPQHDTPDDETEELPAVKQSPPGCPKPLREEPRELPGFPSAAIPPQWGAL